MPQRKIQRRVEPTLAPPPAASGNEPAARPADAAREAVEAVIHATAEAWNSQDFSNVLKLWDPAEPTPVLPRGGTGRLVHRLGNAAQLPRRRRKPSPAVQGIREEMRDIHVKLISPDLALAAWWLHFEMKIIGRRPIGEEVRVSAVLRRTAEGWRYIHWAESPMTGSMYMQKLMERDVDQEKFQACHERSMQRWRSR